MIIMDEGKKTGAKDVFVGGDCKLSSNWKVEEKNFMVSSVLIGVVLMGLNAEKEVRTWRPTRKTSVAAAIEGLQLRGDEYMGVL